MICVFLPLQRTGLFNSFIEGEGVRTRHITGSHIREDYYTYHWDGQITTCHSDMSTPVICVSPYTT